MIPNSKNWKPTNVCGSFVKIEAECETLSSNRNRLADYGQKHRVRKVLEDAFDPQVMKKQ